MMSQLAAGFGTDRVVAPRLSGETRRRLGKALRAVYETTCDPLPIPDAQVELLLQLRHREREMRRTD